MTSKKKLPLAFWIFIGLAVGVVAGLILMNVPDGAGIDVAKNYIKPWGDIFLNLLKFVVVPIVLFSIASGVISMKDISKVGAIGGKTVVYYMCTTAFAVVLALILANVATSVGLFHTLDTTDLSYTPPEGQSIMTVIVNIFPSNAVKPLVDATMLQVIVISLFLGFGILLAGEKGLVAAQIVDSFNEVFMKIMDLIIRLSPIGVACLICPVVAENGPMILRDLVAVLARLCAAGAAPRKRRKSRPKATARASAPQSPAKCQRRRKLRNTCRCRCAKRLRRALSSKKVSYYPD